MKIVNLTPHQLTIICADGEARIYPPALPTPRLEVSREALGEIEGMPVVRSTMGTIANLPYEREGTLLIVSAMVAEHPSVIKRVDLAYPGEPIRNAEGVIIGAKGLCAGPGLARKLKVLSICRG